MQVMLRNKPYDAPEFPPGSGGGFAFGLHKSASTMLFRALAQIGQRTSVPYFDFDRHIRLQHFELENRMLPYEESLALTAYFDRPGVVFGGWRMAPTAYRLPLWRSAKTSLLIRDPRDAVTSLFFSMKFSHTLSGPDGSRLELDRKNMMQYTIDSWVRFQAPRILERFEDYEGLLADTDLLLRRYEDIIYSKERYFKVLCAHFGIEASAEILHEVARSLDEFPESEDILKHVRQVAPGDHKRKLSPATIAHLNEVFAGILRRYDYEV